MKYLFFILFLFTLSCAKHKSVLICGDHKCINKTEAKQYFEENLTIEVQIITKDKKSSFDLVDLNINNEKPEIKVYKNKTNKIVKKLSKKEIKAKKIKLKKNIEKRKPETEITKTKKSTKKITIKKELTSYNTKNNSIDICKKLKKCDIDSITDYLIKVRNEKKYPNISLKE